MRAYRTLFDFRTVRGLTNCSFIGGASMRVLKSLAILVVALVSGLCLEPFSRAQIGTIHIEHRCDPVNCTNVQCYYVSDPSNICSTGDEQNYWYKCMPRITDDCAEWTPWGTVACIGTWTLGGPCTCYYGKCQQ